MKWQRHHTQRPMTWPGHSNDMTFISLATPFHIIDFIGFNKISVLAFAICIWYTMVATSGSTQTGLPWIKRPTDLTSERQSQFRICNTNPNHQYNSLNNTVQCNQTLKLHFVYISTVTKPSFSSTTRAQVRCPADLKRDHHQLWLDNLGTFQDWITMTLDTTSLGGIQVSLDMNKFHKFLLLLPMNYLLPCTAGTLLWKDASGK